MNTAAHAQRVAHIVGVQWHSVRADVRRVFGRWLKDMHELDIALGGTGGTYLGPVLDDVPASYKGKIRSLHARIESLL